MQLRPTLSFFLMALLPVGVLAPGCSSDKLGTKGQLISCTTDPGTGVILRCEPGAGSGSNTCQDIDEDGVGEPHDADDEREHGGSFTDGGSDDDRDGDGIDDDDDCDEHAGEDGDEGLP